MGVNHSQYVNARHMLPPEVRVVELSSNDAWMRDTGPTFVVNAQGEVRGWTGSSTPGAACTTACTFPGNWMTPSPARFSKSKAWSGIARRSCWKAARSYVDGEAHLPDHRWSACPPGAQPQRSAGRNRSRFEGISQRGKVLWIPRGVYNDETSGHVDNLACFLRPGEIALTWTDDRADPQYERSAEALEYLQAQTDARGRRLTIHKIHQPGPLFLTAEEAAGLDAAEDAHPRRAVRPAGWPPTSTSTSATARPSSPPSMTRTMPKP